MKKQLVTLIGCSLMTGGVAIAASTVPAQAVTFSFNNIASENLNGDAIVGQFSFDVTESDDNQVLFKFSNTGEVDSFIRQIYFDDKNSVLSGLTFKGFPDTSSGVAFKNIKENNLNFAQGNNIDFNSSFGVQANKSGSGKDGIDANEFLSVSFDADYAKVLEDIESGALRVGIHVQGIATSNFNSDSFINDPKFNPPPPVEKQSVPEPSITLALGAVGMSLLGLRRRQKQA
jgi:hypothetical protein